jgi:hypothetical protein
MSLAVAPLARADDHTVREIFRSTIALGHPFPFSSDGRRDHLRPYEELCLGWYLDEGRSAAAELRDGEQVIGYALVCLDPGSFDRWLRRATARFLRTVLPRLAARRYPTPVDRFYRLRIRDGWRTWRARQHLPALPHAHLNSVGGAGELPGRLLADHIDSVCRAAGFTAWSGEINARAGRRTAALDRWGAEVVARTPNATLSWLVGAPVERLTIVRRVPAVPRATSRKRLTAA